MRRRRLPISAALAALTLLATGSAVAQVPGEPAPAEPLDPAASLRVTAPNPQPKPDNECYERDDLRCPDLRMGTPQQVYVQRTPAGRTLLRSRNRLQNRGAGPLSLHSERDADESTMRVRQRIYREGARGHISRFTHARLDFWRIPGQGGYWKVRNPVEFQVWTMGAERRMVREGEKSRFCMRDLFRRTGEGPRRAIFPACAQDRSDRSNRQGISVGWDESYPGGYFEQYVDVSGLRGCFKLWHIADPNDRFDESDETNNAAGVVVGLRDGRVRLGRCF